MVTRETQCYFAHSAFHTPILCQSPPQQKSSGSVPCAHVTLSLLPARVLMQAEEQGSDPALYILHKHSGKPRKGTEPLTAVALPAWNTDTTHQNRINTWLWLHLLSGQAHFQWKTHKSITKYLDFLQGENWQPTTKNPNSNGTGAYYKLLRCPTTAKNGSGCSFPLFPVFYTSFLACFQTGTFGFINHCWKYFIFLLTPSFPLCYAQHYNSHHFK